MAGILLNYPPKIKLILLFFNPHLSLFNKLFMQPNFEIKPNNITIVLNIISSLLKWKFIINFFL